MRLFTVLGPAQSGKTTLLQAMGRLDGGSMGSFTTSEAANLRLFRFLGDDWAAIEVAGGVDNLSYAGPALAASDAAVLCVPPESDAAVLSAPYLRLLEESGVPFFLFINRMDTETERVRDIVAALQAYCSHNIVLRQIPIRDGEHVIGAVDLISERAWKYHDGEPSSLIEMPEDAARREREARTELLESLADFDDGLLEQLIEDRQPMTAEVYDVAAHALQHNDLIPAFLGSASHGNGVTRLMKCLRHEVPEVDAAKTRLAGADDVLAVGCLADTVRHLGKVVVVRALEDGLQAGSDLGGGTVGSLTAIDGKTPLATLDKGQIGLTVKTDHLRLGQLYSGKAATDLPDWAQLHRSAYRRIVTPAHERDEARLSNALARLAEVDPGLDLEQDPLSGAAILVMQGGIHARRLVDKLSKEFGVEVELGPVPPAFCETMTKPTEIHHRHRKQSGGAGQFADVIIEVKPQPRGSGFLFEEHVKGGAVPRNYIPSVEAGAQDALTVGPNGFPVVDLCVTLKDGKHHSVDSSDFAFRTAGKNAVREALSSTGTSVLQPIARVQVHVPSTFTGALVSSVSGLKGQVLGFENHPTAAGWDVFNALLPAAELDELLMSLGNSTRGTAWFDAEFDHYEETRTAHVKTPAAGATATA